MDTKPNQDFRKDFREEFITLTAQETEFQVPKGYWRHHHWVLTGPFNLESAPSWPAIKVAVDLLELTLKGEMSHARDWQSVANECSALSLKFQGLEREFRWREIAALQWAAKVAREAVVVALATEKRKLLELLAGQEQLVRSYED